MKLYIPFFLCLAMIGTVAVTAQPTLPPLHTLQAKSIDSVGFNFQTHIITVKLKDGTVLAYNHIDWDLEEEYPLDRRLKYAIDQSSITYTRMQVPPLFPGGDSAFDEYIRQFCIRHKEDLSKRPAELTVVFTVHLKGQLRDLNVVSNTGNEKMADLALQALKEGPQWICATQHGNPVVAYAKRTFTLSQ